MKKLTLIFTLLFSTVMFPSASFAEWTKVSENVNGATFYVDFERIKKHKGLVYYWQLANYLKPTQDGTFSAKSYKEADWYCSSYQLLNSVDPVLYTSENGRELDGLYLVILISVK